MNNEEMNIEEYISFKQPIIEQNQPNEDNVIDRDTLKKIFDITLQLTFLKKHIKKDFVNLPLQYHYTIPIHIIKDKNNQTDREWLENYSPIDERVVFIKGE